LFAPLAAVEEYFEVGEPTVELPPRYNLTPGQAVAVVREHEGVRRLEFVRWGLIPFWAKDAAIGHKLVNARLEGIAAKPSYREAFARRRCLIPASGFYEWAEARGGKRQPYFVRASHAPLLALAGLWERWRTPAGETQETCVVVTTEANATLVPIHHRMPVLVDPKDQPLWLNARSTHEAVTELAARSPALEVWPVTTAVNDPRRDDESLLERLTEEQ
jgi:putative SOS response-associated peptidase YedK